MIESVTQLRELYAAPGARALAKQLSALDGHCRRFIGLSPFVVLSSVGVDGRLDASPRGGEPGFVRVPDDRRLLLPDSPGNNRLDTLQNLIANDRIGMLFMIPGVDETLRVNGRARLVDDAVLLAACADEKRLPKLVIEVSVEEAYLHCAKALMRSRLWDPARRVERSALPTMGEMLRDHAGLAEAESQEAMLARYQKDL